MRLMRPAGVLGKQLELYVADDGGTQDTGINATNLIASQNVVAQVGPNLSGLALAVEGIVSEAGYPMLVGATSPKLVTTINNEWLFRIRASDSIQAQLAAGFMQPKISDAKRSAYLQTVMITEAEQELSLKNI